LLTCRKADEWVGELHLKEGGGVLNRRYQHILEAWKVVATAEEVFETLKEHLGLPKGTEMERVPC